MGKIKKITGVLYCKNGKREMFNIVSDDDIYTLLGFINQVRVIKIYRANSA